MADYGTNITLRIDEKTKREAEALFKDLGLNMSSAITLFLKQSIRDQALPFTIQKVPNSETMEAFREVADILKNPDKYKSYTSAEDLINDILED